MDFKKITTGLACVAMLGAMNAQAELVKGDLEVSGSLSIQEADFGGFTQTSTTISGSVGKMLTDNFQGNVSVYVTGSEFEGGGFSEDSVSGQLALGGDYLFAPRSPIIPYVGASYALSFGDNDDTDFIQLKAGAKTFVSETTSVFGEYRILEAIDSDVDFSINTLAVGISVKF